MTLSLFQIDTPIGEARYATDQDGVMFLYEFCDLWDRSEKYIQKYLPTLSNKPLVETGPYHQTMADYFAGDLSAIDQIPVKLFGTDFQVAAWMALRKIKAGETHSYLQQATGIGRPKAVRAIGMANGANPIPVVLPCHRVIGSSKKLTGYGGGMARKEWLLRHEGADFIN